MQCLEVRTLSGVAGAMGRDPRTRMPAAVSKSCLHLDSQFHIPLLHLSDGDLLSPRSLQAHRRARYAASDPTTALPVMLFLL